MIEDMSEETYQKLIDYAYKKCDTISFTRYEYDNNKNRRKLLQLIKEKLGKEITLDYLEKHIPLIIKEFKDDIDFYNKEYLDNLKKEEIEKNKIHIRKSTIKNIITCAIEDDNIEKFINKYQSSLNLKKEVQTIANYILIEYYFKFDEQMKKVLKERKSILDWQPPETLEDITFYKNHQIWLSTVSHEEFYLICYEDEKEFNYLKSIGLKETQLCSKDNFIRKYVEY